MRSLARRKTRQAERAFLVEGRRLVEDAVSAGVSLRALLVRDGIDMAWVASLGIDPALAHIVEPSTFNASSELGHSQGVAAICDMPDMPDPGGFSGDSLLIVDQMRDPGNLGTLLRSGAASGITTVLTTPGSVDPWAPKVLRAGMGAHFRIAVGVWDDAWRAHLQTSAMTVVVADMDGEQEYDAFDWTAPFAMVVGGETEGLSAGLAELEFVSVRISMARNVESLNAGVAGSILMFEAARQRKNAAG